MPPTMSRRSRLAMMVPGWRLLRCGIVRVRAEGRFYNCGEAGCSQDISGLIHPYEHDASRMARLP